MWAKCSAAGQAWGRRCMDLAVSTNKGQRTCPGQGEGRHTLSAFSPPLEAGRGGYEGWKGAPKRETRPPRITCPPRTPAPPCPVQDTGARACCCRLSSTQAWRTSTEQGWLSLQEEEARPLPGSRACRVPHTPVLQPCPGPPARKRAGQGPTNREASPGGVRGQGCRAGLSRPLRSGVPGALGFLTVLCQEDWMTGTHTPR